ncbi:hypothetical protein M9Y10_032431 [Tritrichomonas musculus]|uniref:Uncharacterized protein n=1 Tax=Tritrichomonas musculus TaxID=1915356 RepID=A0ABR2GZC4_9EUKA
MISNKLISQLTKKEILQLPGFAGLNKILLPNLKNTLRAHLMKTKIFKRGVRVNDYLNYCKQQKLDSIKVETSPKQVIQSKRNSSNSNHKLNVTNINEKIKPYKDYIDEYT